MLEQMRRSSQSLLIYLLFAIVIAVFIINFGPQSGGGCEAQVANTSHAATVEGRSVSGQDFKYAYLLLGGGGQMSGEQARQRRLKETIMDKLIERELLGREAERLGFRVGDEEVEDLISDSKIMVLGFEDSLSMVQKDGKFDYEMFKRFVQYQLGLSPRAFIDQQRREMMAERVRDLLRGGVNVSLDEVQTDFVRRGHQANVEFLRFPLSRYEAQIEVTPAEIESWAKANEDKLKKRYEERKFLYEKAPKERKLRQILVKVEDGGSPDADEAAKKKAEALAARVSKGEAFAAVAKAASEDAPTKGRGGDLGWKRQQATTLGSAIEEKVWAAKDGEVVGPLKGADGWYLLLPEGTREGDIPFEKVRLELAEDLLRAEKAKARAKADADAALAKAKGQSAKTLKEIFSPEKEKKEGEKEAEKEKPKAKGEEEIQVEETGLFMRQGAIVPVIGTSPELARTIFDLETGAPMAGPVEVGGAYVVVRLKERKTPDMAEFEAKKLELQRQAAMVKGEEVVMEWSLRRCQDAKESKRLSVNKDILKYEVGPEGSVAYEPCTPPPRF